MSRRPIFRKIAYVMRVIALVLVSAVVAVLWQLNRGLPKSVCRWLERKLSRGIVTTRFDDASFNLLDGIRIKNAQMFIKHRLGPPLLQVDEIWLDGKIFLDRPPATWIREITMVGLVCQPEFDFPETESGSDSLDLASYLRHLSVENDWTDEPVRFLLRDSTVFTVSFRELEFDATIEGARVIASPLRLTIDSLGFEEELKGNVEYDASKFAFSGHLAGTLTPEVVRELTLLLDGETAVEYYDYLGNYSAPLKVDASVLWLMETDDRPISTQEMRVTVKGDDFTFNGLPVRHVDFGLHWEKAPTDEGKVRKKVTFDPLHCTLDEGEASLRAVWYPRKHKMDFIAHANLYPSSFLTLLDMEHPAFLTNVTFATPLDVKANGTIGMGPNREQMRVLVDVDDVACTAYGTPIENFRTTGSLTGRDYLRISLPNFSATCYDGRIKGATVLSFSPTNDAPAFTLSMRMEDINCGKARNRAGINKEGDSKGRISGDFHLSGLADENCLDSLSGMAKFKIRGGLLLRFPLFAGLTDFLGRNIPGVDFLLMQSDADIGVSAEEGLAEIEHLSVEGNVFSLAAKGRCRYNRPDLPVEMVAQLRFFKQRTLIGRLARLMMLPASKFLEFRVSGPVENASWNYIGLVDRIPDWTFWPEKDATDLSVSPSEDEGIPLDESN